MILDFEDVNATKAQKLLEDLAVAKFRLEVIHAALLDRTDIKMTPEGQGYRAADTTGYTNTNIAVPTSPSFVSSTHCSEYGLLPTATTGSSSTYFCDYLWIDTGNSLYVMCVGATLEHTPSYDGAFAYHVSANPQRLIWHNGCYLSYVYGGVKMTDWQIVHGSQDVKPAEFDTTSSAVYVYQRRNVQRVTVENEFGTSELWQYEERKFTRDEYNALRAELLETELTNTQLALTELYETILGGNSNG